MSEQVQTGDMSDLKNFAVKLPDPVRSLILSSKEDISEEEFLAKLIEWRKLLRIQKEAKE